MFTNQHKPYNKPDHMSHSLEENQSHDKTLRFSASNSVHLSLYHLWRRQWHPTPVLLPGESQGWGSLVGCRLWGCIESDTTEAT